MRENSRKVDDGLKFVAHRRESYNSKDDGIQDLATHLKETASLTGKFAEKIGLKKHGELIGLLHDLGKATKEFYQYICSATGLIDPDTDDYIVVKDKKGKIDHSTAGAQVIYSCFYNKNKDAIWLVQILPLIIASHHSGLINCLSPDGIDCFSERMQKSEKKTRVSEALNNLNNEIAYKINELLLNSFLIKDLNLKISSLKEENDTQDLLLFKIGLLTKYLFSCLIDADRLNTANFEFPDALIIRNHGHYIGWSVLKKNLENHLNSFRNNNRIDSLRQEISNYCLTFAGKSKGLYQLTVPTGGGKTLSSLRFAINHALKHNMDRIIYIIPYTSIIDQNADCVRRIFEENIDNGTGSNNVVLEHHSNLTPEKENTRQKLLSENWDASIIFTTMVQFLETIFGHGTRSIRRMHQLANTVLIFDEIQTLPIQYIHIFNMTIRFLIKGCGATIVLCTATQPLLDQVKPDNRALFLSSEHQIVPDVKKYYQGFKRVKIQDLLKIGGWSEDEVVLLVKEKLVKFESVLIIVNTKKSAKKLFQMLKKSLQADIFHLSTNMCPIHRMQILKTVKNSLADLHPIVCVSTQLIEAGVDIDFGAVIRYLAGLDSIAQAAGRCNRNGLKAQLGSVTIINPQKENLDKMKDIKIGRDKAERVISEFKKYPDQFDHDLIGFKAMERYYQYYFYEQSKLMNYPVSFNSKVGRDDNLFELLATNNLSVAAYQRINQNTFPEIFLRQSFMTAAEIFKAIDSPTRGVIVPYERGEQIIIELCETVDLKKQYQLLKEAQRYSVNLFPYIFEDLVKQKIIREVRKDIEVFYLDKQYYSKDYGLSEEPESEMEFLNY